MSALPRRKPPIPCPRCGAALLPVDEPGGVDILTSARDSTVIEALTVEVIPHKCPNLSRMPRTGPQWGT